MKRFLTESVLPVGGVVIAVIALTLVLFEVPSRPQMAVAGLRVPASAAPIATSEAARQHLDDTLTRVMRTLDDGRRQADAPAQSSRPPEPKPAGPAIPPPAVTAATAPPNPGAAPTTTALSANGAKLLDATSALATAVRAIHEARTEEDIVRAEELVRSAREQMEANCATAPGPLCESAQQIRSLGY